MLTYLMSGIMSSSLRAYFGRKPSFFICSAAIRLSSSPYGVSSVSP